jgi:hypothetical protein
MSLDFYYSKVSEEGRKLILTLNDYHSGSFVNGFCQQLSFTLMNLGMSGVTKDNIDEFIYREIVFRKVYGESTDLCISREKLEVMVGFEVNVRNTTRAQFMKDMMRRLDEQIKEELYRRAGGYDNYMAARRKKS